MEVYKISRGGWERWGRDNVSLADADSQANPAGRKKQLTGAYVTLFDVMSSLLSIYSMSGVLQTCTNLVLTSFQIPFRKLEC